MIGRLVEEFGYVDSGRTYAVADPREAWVVEVVRGRRWVAQRVPDDAVVILPARHVIGEIDLDDADNFRASPDLVSYAAKRGWFDPAGGKPFNFRLAYQVAERTGPAARQFRGQAVVSGKPAQWPPAEPLPFSIRPPKRLSVADVAALLRDPGGVAAFFNKSTQEAADFQLRSNLPTEIGCVYWRTTGRPDISVFTPWHAGITARPKAMAARRSGGFALAYAAFSAQARGFPARRRAWWKFKRLARAVDQALRRADRDSPGDMVGDGATPFEEQSQASRRRALGRRPASRQKPADPILLRSGTAACDLADKLAEKLAEKLTASRPVTRAALRARVLPPAEEPAVTG